MDSITRSLSSSRGTVLAALLSTPLTDRQQIMAQTGLSQATVFRAVDALIGAGIVREGEPVKRMGPGRQATGLIVHSSSFLVCGVDLGGTNCRFVLSDATGLALVRTRRRTPRALNAIELADWIADQVHRLVTRYGDGVSLETVGVGLPGVFSLSKRKVIGSQNLGEIRGTAFVQRLEESLGVATAFENDSNLALLGEQSFGAESEPGTKVLLILGTGLSAAVSMNDHIVGGENGLLGEFGRLPLPGRQLRLRDLVSGAGLLARARVLGYELSSPAEVFAEPGRFGSLEAEVNDAFLFLVSLVALSYEPKTVYVAGGFSESYGVAGLAEVADQVETAVGVRVDLRRSTLGDAAGLLGAMALGLSELYRTLGLGDNQMSRMSAWKNAALDRFNTCPVARDEREK